MEIGNSLSREEVLAIIDKGKNYVVVDIRSCEEFKSNHFNGAINVPLIRLESITKIVHYRNTYILVYCSSGLLSEDATKRLRKMGYKNAYNMGGIYNYTDYIYIE